MNLFDDDMNATVADITRLEHGITLLAMQNDVLKAVLLTKGIVTKEELEQITNAVRESEPYKQTLDKGEYFLRIMDMADSGKPLSQEDEDYIRNSNHWDDKEEVEKFINYIKMLDVFDGILRTKGDQT